MYQDDAKTVHGLACRPSVGEWNSSAQGASMFEHPRRVGRWVQTTKGLSNFSSIKFGDDRIQRVSSAYREEYRSPEDRRSFGRPVIDPSFRNVASTGHAGVGLFTKSYLMADEVAGHFGRAENAALSSSGHTSAQLFFPTHFFTFAGCPLPRAYSGDVPRVR